VSAARRVGTLLVLLLAACGGEERPVGVEGAAARSAPAAARPDEPRLGPYRRSELFLEHDLFLSVDEPRVVRGDAAEFLKSGDEVLGLVVGGRARAYPVTMISYHHVVNDVIEGIPVAVTY
jgi:hypothetical protein